MHKYFQNLWLLVLIRNAGEGKTRIPAVQTTSSVSTTLTGAACDVKRITAYLHVVWLKSGLWDIMPGRTVESCCLFIILHNVTSQNTTALQTIRNLVTSMSYRGFGLMDAWNSRWIMLCTHARVFSKDSRPVRFKYHILINSAETEQLHSKTKLLYNFCENNLYFKITKHNSSTSTNLISLILIVTSHCFSQWCLDRDKIQWSFIIGSYKYNNINLIWKLYTFKNGQEQKFSEILDTFRDTRHYFPAKVTGNLKVHYFSDSTTN